MSGRIKNNDRQERLLYPIIGHIRCGKKSDRGFPMSTDYWLADGKYASLFDKAYGDKPDTIQIVFPSDNPELVCREEYEFRDAQGKLVHLVTEKPSKCGVPKARLTRYCRLRNILTLWKW